KFSTTTIESSGGARNFHWYTPRNIKGNTIIFVLHGSTGTGEGVREQTAYEFDQLADKEGFVVVYPTGYANHWNDCRGSADYQANTEDIDDITFLKAIEKHLSEQLNHSFQYRFSTGHSNGGHFSFKLALEAPEWINGIAAISANLPIAANLDCQKKGKFVPVLIMNGTADPVNPYDGGLVSILGNDSRGTVLSTDATMDYWLSLDTCQLTMTKQTLADKIMGDNSTVEQTSWQCGGTTKAIVYKMIGAGHTMPHPKSIMPKLLGPTNQDINAVTEIWSFFKQLRNEKTTKKI
ncbi:MAG: PHB depolymerase family esterase, partial [Saprospiraceae bacterium]